MSNFNSRTMVNWLRAMVQAMPHGGKKKAAEMLDLTPSGLSKLLNNEERGFDEKTLRAVAWVESSKSSRYALAEYPVHETIIVGPLVVETRRPKGGNIHSEFFTWKPLNPKK